MTIEGLDLLLIEQSKVTAFALPKKYQRKYEYVHLKMIHH